MVLLNDTEAGESLSVEFTEGLLIFACEEKGLVVRTKS